jgi:hypothetical protein
MIEQSIYNALQQDTINTAVDGRIYPLVLPADSPLPAITYQIVGGSSQGTQDTHGTQRYRVQVDCWGETYGDAVTLRNAVIAALDHYNVDGVYITLLQPTDFFDHDALQYRAMVEFYVFSSFN